MEEITTKQVVEETEKVLETVEAPKAEEVKKERVKKVAYQLAIYDEGAEEYDLKGAKYVINIRVMDPKLAELVYDALAAQHSFVAMFRRKKFVKISSKEN